MTSNKIPALQMDRGNIVDGMGALYGRLSDCSVTFAHELTHRANAYPKLVDALRTLAGLVESGMLINHPQACAERREENAEAYAAARKILSELGEQS